MDHLEVSKKKVSWLSESTAIWWTGSQALKGGMSSWRPGTWSVFSRPTRTEKISRCCIITSEQLDPLPSSFLARILTRKTCQILQYSFCVAGSISSPKSLRHHQQFSLFPLPHPIHVHTSDEHPIALPTSLHLRTKTYFPSPHQDYAGRSQITHIPAITLIRRLRTHNRRGDGRA